MEGELFDGGTYKIKFKISEDAGIDDHLNAFKQMLHLQTYSDYTIENMLTEYDKDDR